MTILLLTFNIGLCIFCVVLHFRITQIEDRLRVRSSAPPVSNERIGAIVDRVEKLERKCKECGH